MLKRFAASAALALGAAALLAGCANDNLLGGGSNLTTASVAPTPPVDPACVTLTAQIDTLRKEGVAEKIEKAAAKKYKMTPADLAKADQLTKANAEFQTKCSTVTPKASTAQAPAAASTQVASAASKPASGAAVKPAALAPAKQ